MERSGGVLVHLCSGSQHWKIKPQANFWVLEVDIDHGQDLLTHSVWSYLLFLARRGLIRGIIGGPWWTAAG